MEKKSVKEVSLMEKMNRKGVSPVIATVLLVAMVVVLALIVFLWFKGLTKEAVTKFGGTNIELVCGDVSFSSEYNNGILTISNDGNVPIYGMNAKIVRTGSYETKDIKDLTASWPSAGLKQGGIFSGDLSTQFSGAKQVTLIPVLVGTSQKGERVHACTEQNGQQLTL